MRTIKFRAWHNRAEKMLESGTNRQIFSWQDEGQDITIMQYTGLDDVNGKPIYEGDVVKDRFNRIMQVKWWNYRLCWVAITETNFHHADLFQWAEDDEEGYITNKTRVEIIGNIYENPELVQHD